MTDKEKLAEIARLCTYYTSPAKALMTMQTPESVLDGIIGVLNQE